MSQPNKRTLVLMRDSSAIEEPTFVADLYSGKIIEDSVYLDQAAMLEWVRPLDPRAGFVAARAMEELLVRPPRTIIDIPLSAAQ